LARVNEERYQNPPVEDTVYTIIRPESVDSDVVFLGVNLLARVHLDGPRCTRSGPSFTIAVENVAQRIAFLELDRGPGDADDSDCEECYEERSREHHR
jgi:hypothetical protein